MGYRKLTIRDEEYRYSIGKKGTKIVYPDNQTSWIKKEDIGFVIGKDIVVTPKMIVDYIQGSASKNPEKYFPSCRHNKRNLVINPYELEIKGKRKYLYFCDECFSELECDI